MQIVQFSAMLAPVTDHPAERRYRTGDRIEDLCRACKALRAHTVMAVGGDPPVIRVVCGYCGSLHNYRGGESRSRGSGMTGASRAAGIDSSTTAPGSERGLGGSRSGPARDAGGSGSAVAGAAAGRQAADRGRSGSIQGFDQGGAFPLVVERERRYAAMSVDQGTGMGDLEMLLRRVFREETGLGPAVPADKWRGGEMVLRPGKPGLQEKIWPIETFFHKVVMLRNRLRVLEQQINGSELPDDDKVRLQGYITGCYGSLTSFNVLFANEEDRFQGSGGND